MSRSSWIGAALFFAIMCWLASLIDARANRTEAYAKQAASCALTSNTGGSND